MYALHEQLQNPLTRERDASDRARITAAFPALQSCSHPHFLALRRYLDSRPERFFDETVYGTYLNWLQERDETDGKALKAYLSGCRAEINRALLFLREINSEEWHDRPLRTGDEYDLVRFIDKHVHPTYLRMIEAVLVSLTRPLAYFSRLDRGKHTDGLAVSSVMQELEGQPAECLILSYRRIVRNGIAHGGITFLQSEIRYRDKKGNEETLGTAFIVRLCDDLLDTCNGLAAALKVFYSVSRDRGYIPPRELLVEELQEETLTPWWGIEGCVESEIAGKPQLIVYARPDSRDYAKVQWSTIQSGILAEFFAPGYDRYCFSLRPRKAWPGWAAFDGKKIRKLREAGADDLSSYKGIVENDLIFYVARPTMPALFGKLDTFAKGFRIHIPIAMRQFRESLGIPSIVCRNAAVHRNSWGAVLDADVVIEGLEDETAVDIVRKHRRRIVRLAIRHARKLSWQSAAAFLPLGYAHVAVFRQDYRRRRLSGFGLGSDLVCTVRHQRIARIESPDIMDSTVETMGRWRLAWNKAWLETSGQQSGNGSL